MTEVSLGIPAMPAPDYPADVRQRLDEDAAKIIARYPGSRSALLPLLHLVQAEESYVSRTGVRFCAEQLGLTTAEVTAVATFYSMYRRGPPASTRSGSAPTRCARSWAATRSSTSSSNTSAWGTARPPTTARSRWSTSSATRPATSPPW